ncbi:MAG: hypothetical protein Q4G62_00420 [Pseudomonadota bacterium]|nr:hypothetical protein [Pseudomonadota bacterium]
MKLHPTRHSAVVLVSILLTLATVFAVHASDGFYETIRYRKNDPFVFCTQGPSIRHGEIRSPACWKPLPPFLGQWAYTGGCNPPNKYGRKWDHADHDSLAQYQRICPKGGDRESGSWEGPGRPELTPIDH